MILAGDIGGTKTVLALFEEHSSGMRQHRDATYDSGAYASLDEIIKAFLADETKLSIAAGCLGVAGPVIDGSCITTNLPWQLQEAALARLIGTSRVKLINDLEAAAYGMLFLEPDAFGVINVGTPSTRRGNIAVIAAGTGLGEAILYWDGDHLHPIATEGGHSSFAPVTPQEIDLLQYLSTRFDGHVGYERVLSGPGLYNVYDFLRYRSNHPEPEWLTTKLQGGDPSPVISQIGLEGQDPVCAAALNLFSSIYGAEAGNLALKCMALGGVYLGGGIAPKILSVLQNGSFMRGFTTKGRFADLLRGLEVKVALNTRAPLIGAAHFAMRL